MKKTYDEYLLDFKELLKCMRLEIQQNASLSDQPPGEFKANL